MSYSLQCKSKYRNTFANILTFKLGRKPQYALNDVFESAISVVLAKGYRGCSMGMLINATEFNRRAFYLEFTNKQACFAQGLAISNNIQQGNCDALIVIKTLFAELP